MTQELIRRNVLSLEFRKDTEACAGRLDLSYGRKKLIGDAAHKCRFLKGV